MAFRHGVLLATVALLVVTACTGQQSDVQEPSAVEAPQASATPDAGDLLARLRAGGLTIVFRHAATDRSDPDDPTVDLDDCSTQRNLSDEGRADAELIGESISDLDIPVGDVWASPYCRSRDTAELAFGRAEVVHGLERLYPQPDEQAEQRLNQRIRAQAPRAGEPNLVISAHGVYPSVLSPGVDLREGEAAVYARQDDGLTLLGRVEPAGWADLGSDTRALRAAADRVLDSVVALRGPQGTGSAFRVAVPGILVTNAHLVADASQVAVTLRDGTQRTAQVLGRRPEVDIAALRVGDDSDLPPLHSGSGLAQARVGDPVLALGAPETVTEGSIRAMGEQVPLTGGAELAALRTDAGIPPASTGGPLIDAEGYVLGVLTAATTARGGVAVPVDVARDAALGIVRS